MSSKTITLRKEAYERLRAARRHPGEETVDGVFLRGGTVNKLSWEDTYRARAAEREDWSDPDAMLADGLE